uniref:Myb/SANT-like DNA-binding domain-containing protein n=1 Tax=Salmo trutta TaxID=8032 RepID=A0A673ZND5_SALTR
LEGDDVGWTWSPEETKALISVWSNEQILQKMEQTYRNKHVYSEISERLKDLGVKRTWKQCQNKMKALKWRYRETLRNPSSSRPCPFFSELHEFLAAMPDMPESKETDDEEDNGKQIEMSSFQCHTIHVKRSDVIGRKTNWCKKKKNGLPV